MGLLLAEAEIRGVGMLVSDVQANAIKELLRDVLTDVSPEEILLVDHVALSRSATDDNADGMLGFGGGPELALFLPILSEVLVKLAGTVTANLAKEWGSELAAWITHHKHESIDPSAFSTLGKLVTSRLERQGIPASQAMRASDSMIATMISRPDLVRKLVRS